jgi:purine-nucleoside phosphorylase
MNETMPEHQSVEKSLHQSMEYLKNRVQFKPAVGIILGSGLGSYADSLAEGIGISTAEIPHYPVSTVAGHQGRLVFGYQDQVPVLAVQGRTHFYEGNPLLKVTWVIRMMSELGIRILIVTNAAGGINPSFEPGTLMLIKDQINLMFQNPLIGESAKNSLNKPTSRFLYDERLSDLIAEISLSQGIPLKTGILAGVLGPTYETAAEIRMLRKLGADAVSMSTIPEVLMAGELGIRAAGISCITNKATGLSKEALSHEEVTRVAGRIRKDFQRLISRVIGSFSEILENN